MFSHVPRKHRGVRGGGVMCAKNGWSKEGQWRNLQGHRAHLGVRFADPAIVIDNLPERGRGKRSVNSIGAERCFLSHPRVALRSRCWQIPSIRVVRKCSAQHRLRQMLLAGNHRVFGLPLRDRHGVCRAAKRPYYFPRSRRGKSAGGGCVGCGGFEKRCSPQGKDRGIHHPVGLLCDEAGFVCDL
jgi:hypothetical protein